MSSHMRQVNITAAGAVFLIDFLYTHVLTPLGPMARKTRMTVAVHPPLSQEGLQPQPHVENPTGPRPLCTETALGIQVFCPLRLPAQPLLTEAAAGKNALPAINYPSLDQLHSRLQCHLQPK